MFMLCKFCLLTRPYIGKRNSVKFIKHGRIVYNDTLKHIYQSHKFTLMYVHQNFKKNTYKLHINYLSTMLTRKGSLIISATRTIQQLFIIFFDSALTGTKAKLMFNVEMDGVFPNNRTHIPINYVGQLANKLYKEPNILHAMKSRCQQENTLKISLVSIRDPQANFKQVFLAL